MRFALALALPKPWGTLAANVLGTTVLALAVGAFRLARGVPFAPYAPAIGSDDAWSDVDSLAVGPMIFAGVCGSLTTVSTLVSEANTLPRAFAYRYMATTVAICLALALAIGGTFYSQHDDAG